VQLVGTCSTLRASMVLLIGAPSGRATIMTRVLQWAVSR
jgi:hypothetical protein